MRSDRFIDLNRDCLSRQFHRVFSCGEAPYSLYDQYRRSIAADCVNATDMYDDLTIQESRDLMVFTGENWK